MSDLHLASETAIMSRVESYVEALRRANLGMLRSRNFFLYVLHPSFAKLQRVYPLGGGITLNVLRPDPDPRFLRGLTVVGVLSFGGEWDSLPEEVRRMIDRSLATARSSLPFPLGTVLCVPDAPEPEPEVPADPLVHLWPVQRELHGYVKTLWRVGFPASVYVGQRGGGTTLLRSLAEGEKHPVFVAYTKSHALDMLGPGFTGEVMSFHSLANVLDAVRMGDSVHTSGERWDVDRLAASTFLLDNPFIVEGTVDLCSRLRNYTSRIAAIGCMGTTAWPWPTLSIPTWVINPNTPDDLEEEFRRDPERARRDFGCGLNLPT